jgi:hypothetical protein
MSFSSISSGAITATSALMREKIERENLMPSNHENYK